MNSFPAKKVLDLGCSRRKIPGAIGVDISPDSQADVLHDLNKSPYPFSDNSFDEIFAKHIIEHLDKPEVLIKEIFRLLKPGGTAFIETPPFFLPGGLLRTRAQTLLFVFHV